MTVEGENNPMSSIPSHPAKEGKGRKGEVLVAGGRLNAVTTLTKGPPARKSCGKREIAIRAAAVAAAADLVIFS